MGNRADWRAITRGLEHTCGKSTEVDKCNAGFGSAADSFPTTGRPNLLNVGYLAPHEAGPQACDSVQSQRLQHR